MKNYYLQYIYIYIYFESKTITIVFLSNNRRPQLCFHYKSNFTMGKKNRRALLLRIPPSLQQRPLRLLQFYYMIQTLTKKILFFFLFYISRRLLLLLYDDDNINSFYFILQLQLGEMDNINVTLMEFLKWRMEIDSKKAMGGGLSSQQRITIPPSYYFFFFFFLPVLVLESQPSVVTYQILMPTCAACLKFCHSILRL